MFIAPFKNKRNLESLTMIILNTQLTCFAAFTLAKKMRQIQIVL